MQTGDLEAAIAEFHAALPGWWFTVGYCSLSRDASCGPEGRMLGDKYPYEFDNGFHCDDSDGTLASSLRDVTAQAVSAIGARKTLPDVSISIDLTTLTQTTVVRGEIFVIADA